MWEGRTPSRDRDQVFLFGAGIGVGALGLSVLRVECIS